MSAPRSHAPRHTAPRYVPSGRRRRFLSEQIRLVILLALSACTLIALQTTILSRFPLPFSWSAPAAPSLALLLVLAVGFQLGEQEGSVCGLAVGWLCDAVGSRDVMLLPLVYFLCGWLSGVVGRRRLAHNLPSFFVFAMCGGVLEAVYKYLLAAADTRAFPPPVWMLQALFPPLFLTVLFSPAVYGLVKLIHREE